MCGRADSEIFFITET